MRVTASHIIEWVNTKSKVAQTELPRLVRRLCFNSVSTRQLAFPAGDSTFVPGWDGVLFSEHGNAWVPTGASRWEMGCDQGQTAKANKDYKKRLEQTSLGERSSSTFIFVTPRRWTSKAEWIAKQRAKGDWADVRAYDADDLEQWLEQSHSVALQFAEEIGLIGWGVESLSRFWKLWSAQCSPQITPDALFIDRSVAHEKLIEKIRAALSQPNHEHRVVVRADSAEEAVAFVVATLLETEDLADKALVVTEAEGWRFVDANDQLRIAIASRTDVAATPATRPGLLNVIPYAMGDVGELLQGEELILERPQIYEFEKALIAIGVEESDANRYALSTGRSWAIFRRQRSTNPAIRVPAWLDITQSNSLATLCLLGAWRADKEADREVVAQLAARSYEDVERDLRTRLRRNDRFQAPGLHSIWSKRPIAQ